MGRLSRGIAEGAYRAGRAFARVLPPGVLKQVEDRVFYVIFQRTRVENDAYGWRPPPDSGG